MYSSALPNLSTSFPPKTLMMGTPESWNQDGPGTSGKFTVSVEFPQKTSCWGTPKNFILGTPFLALWRDFKGGNETGQSWHVGHGWWLDCTMNSRDIFWCKVCACHWKWFVRSCFVWLARVELHASYPQSLLRCTMEITQLIPRQCFAILCNFKITTFRNEGNNFL